ncbi:MAG: SDR family NAD(P)-dependent oxidoreductase [Dehalococcoidia bacterium]
MDLGLEGKNALVTGGSRGLGRQSALALAAEGCNVAICARNEETLRKTEAELRALGRGKAVGLVADLSDPTQANPLFDAAEASLGRIDILVNNVGGRRGSGTGWEATTLQDIQATFDINVWVAYALIRRAIPGMKERRWGRIINISSVFGREYGGALAYMMAKAAVIAMSKSLAVELAPHNVLVNSVAPGSIQHPGGTWERFVQTQSPEVVKEFISRNLPMGRFGWPEPVGRLVAFLASDVADLITGASINIDGGQSRSLI